MCFIILLFYSCKNRHTPDFYFTENGLKYKYHDIVTDGVRPKSGAYLNMYMDWKTTEDSIIYSSKSTQLSGIQTIRLGEPKIKGGIEEGFSKLIEGDSVTLYINPKKFYENYLMMKLPSFLEKEKEMMITLRLLSVFDSIQQEKYKKDLLVKAKANEQSKINSILDKWKNEYDTIYSFGDIHYISKVSTGNKQINIGDKVRVDYECKFYNNNLYFTTFSSEPHVFEVGLEGQMIEGFNYLLQKLSYGDQVVAIIPSSLAFGYKGSSDNKVPPYMPLIFNVRVLEKN